MTATNMCYIFVVLGIVQLNYIKSSNSIKIYWDELGGSTALGSLLVFLDDLSVADLKVHQR